MKSAVAFACVILCLVGAVWAYQATKTIASKEWLKGADSRPPVVGLVLAQGQALRMEDAYNDRLMAIGLVLVGVVGLSIQGWITSNAIKWQRMVFAYSGFALFAVAAYWGWRLTRTGDIDYINYEQGTVLGLGIIGVAMMAASRFFKTSGTSSAPAPEGAAARRQLVGSACVICGRRIVSTLEAKYCEACGKPVHCQCAAQAAENVTAESACATCGAVTVRRGPAAVEG
jgi:hypothetical protein